MTVNTSVSAMYSIAACARIYCARLVLGIIFSAAALSGCSALPDKPQRATLFDFGPGAVVTQPVALPAALPAPQPAAQPAAQPGARPASLPAVAIDDVTTPGGVLDNSAILYRLGYQDAQELRTYSLARWSMPPSQLVRQRLRDQLALSRPVYNARESLALNRTQNAVLPLQVRLELLEFSHFFSAPDVSVGLIKLRATLVEVTTSGEKLISQRSIALQRPAPTADAQGGVRALTLATDAAIAEVEQWLQSAPANPPR